MRHVILVWYTWLSALSQGYVFSIGEWSDGLALAPASAVLFGLIAAASPCQLTTNLAALAYAAREFPRGATFSAALAYAAGKVSVYMVVGVLVVVASFQLQAHSVPVVVVARKLLGARMVLVGLGMLGVVRLRGGFGFPGLFALGSTLPLLVLSGVVALGFGALEATVGKLSRVQRIASAVAGAVFILAGLHDTVVYWWL